MTRRCPSRLRAHADDGPRASPDAADVVAEGDLAKLREVERRARQ